MNLQTLQEKIIELNQMIQPILCELGCLEHTPPTVEWDEENPNECMIHDELQGILSHLSYIQYVVDYLQKPVTHEGILIHDSNGKHMIGDVELTDEDCIEVLRFDEAAGKLKWKRIYLEDSMDLIGQKARIRGKGYGDNQRIVQ